MPDHGTTFLDGPNGAITTEETNLDGTSDSYIVAGPYSQKVWVDRIIWEHAGTNIASAARLYWNNGDDKEYAKNNRKIQDKLMPAYTLDQADEAVGLVMDVRFELPVGHTLLVSFGTVVASGYFVTSVIGPYQYSC